MSEPYIRRKLDPPKGRLELHKKLVVFSRPCIWSVRSYVAPHMPNVENARNTLDPTMTFGGVGGTNSQNDGTNSF